MKKHPIRPSMGLLFSIACLAGAQAQTVTWDGDASDGLWDTAANWDGDTLPAAGNDVVINNGDSVAGTEFNTTFNITLSGGSSLTDPVTNFAGGAWRAGGASVIIGSGSTFGSGAFYDLQNATLTFKDGAAVSMSSWEQKDINVFNFELSASGFTAITPGAFRIGNGGLTADIANATYNVDMAAYTGGPATIVLADFASDAFGMDNATFQGAGGLNVLNPGSYTANIQWNDVTEAIELVISGGAAPPITWDGGGSGDSWLTAENWDPDGVPGATDDVLVGTGAAVTDAPNSFGSLEIEAGATVTFPGEFLNGSKTLDVDGTLDGAGLLRFGAAMDLSGSLGSGITFLDTGNSTINFEDGAAFDNAAMSFEHKGTNTFGYKISTTGFTTISAGQLSSGAGAVWSDATYNIDISDYDDANGTTIVLVDYSGHAAAFDGTFDPTVNIEAGSSGLNATLSFDTTESRLVLSLGDVQGEIVDVFIATGQSNAYWPPTADLSAGTYQFGHGVEDALVASGLFSNPVVVIAGVPGQEIAAWYNDLGPNGLYNQEFFDTTNVGTGLLEAQINAIIANGDTPRFRGLFWFQGEADGLNGTEAQYAARWNGLLTQIASDVGTSEFNFVMNKVGNSGTLINDTLTTITDADPRGALFDTQVAPYRTNPDDIHGYDHYLVGQANAQLFIDAFVLSTVDVFIIAGQSNANGQGLVSDLTTQQATQDALFFNSWHLQAFNAESTQDESGWLPQTVAGETRSTGNVSSTFGGSPWFGPEMGFVSRANEINLTANPMAILKYAVDGSALTADVNYSDWDLTAATPNDGDCWRGFQTALADAVAGLQAAGHTPNFKGMVWWQGENGTNATDLNAFIAEVRNHLASNYGLQNSSTFPVVITGNEFWGAGLETGVAELDAHVGFIDSVAYGQTGGYTNVHPGSGQDGNPTDVTGNGLNDMWDFGVAYADEMALAIAGSTGPPSSTYDSIWDGGGSGDSWATPGNWDPDGVPGATDDVLVGTGATVTDAANSFGSLEIESGATVTFPGQFLDGSKTLDVAGTLDGGGVLRFGATMNLSGSLGPNITFLDTNNSTINFADGASFANPNLPFEHKGTNTFGYKLSSTGFTTISAGQLFSGAGATWSDVTYNIDLSEYDQSNGLSIVLADYSGHSAAYSDPFNPTVNIIAGGSGLGGLLTFDTLSSQLLLAIDPPGNDAPVASDLTYSTDGTALGITLSATDIEGDPLTYTVVSGPSQGSLDGTPPNLSYTYTGTDFTPDSFTYKANDGSVDSNTATVSIIPVQQTVSDLWGSLQSSIESDALNSATHTTWTEPHSDGSGSTITISRVTYELGTLVGTQHTSTPVIAAYYARPTGGTNLPGLLQNHGGGQRALSYIAKFWAEQGYAAICINWGGLNLTAMNPNEPAPAPGQTHPNTNWDGLAGGFTRVSTPTEPIENPVTEAIFKSDVDPAVYSDGQTLYAIPHPLNSSWSLNGYAGRRAITFLQDQPEVDDSRIGVLGWSMGGRTTMMTSTDPRITVLAPAVGGTGFLFEDFWGLPGTARSSNGWQDPDLFRNTVDDQSYWPVVSAPVLFLNGSNDFNAPFDLATKSLSIHEVGLNDVSPDNILATSPHYNHRVTDPVLASRIHWMRHHLKGDIDFPGISDADLELTTPDGVPVFKVHPDTSTPYPVVSVDIVYGSDRDSRTRFWRDAAAVDMGTHWEAKLPVFDANEMMAAHAIITYDIGFTQLMPAGSSPTSLFSVASQVHTYYPNGVDTTGYPFPADLDTDIHQFHLRSSEQLVADGLRETAEISHAIDDPSSPRGYKDWFVINPGNSVLWQFYTRKINDPCFRGGDGAQLTFDLTANAANTLVVKIIVDQWSENSTTTYLASVPIAVGLNQVSLSVADFKRADNTPLDAWSRARFIGFGSGQAFNLNSDGWAGSVPTLADLAWDGGVTILDGGVTSTWLESFGLPLSNDAVIQDTDGDGSINGDEFKAGTDPTNSLSLLKISSTELQGGNLVLEWSAVAGKTYSLWSSGTLEEGSWILEESGISSPDATASRSLPMNGARGFFRVQVE